MEKNAPVGEKRRRFTWKGFGGDGFVVSLALHVILVLVALFWVVSTFIDSPNEEPSTFITGSGGGNQGDIAKIFDHRMTPKNVRNLVRNPAKLVARGASSSIALPEMPDMGMNVLQGGLTAGGLSKGLGGGSGGGIGTGRGLGAGGGKNLVGKFIMGARVQAEKIAVYLDNSGSMTPYLPQVKREIYSQFPDADIFEYNGIVTWVHNGSVHNGRDKTVEASGGNREKNSGSNKLSPLGEKIFRRYGANFHRGSVGAWLDVMQREKYDALVIFSDFQDGVRQYENNKLIFAETMRTGVQGSRTRAQKRWEEDWVRQFKREDSPRLYLFSIQVEPQSFLKRCVEASKGEIKMVTELRQARKKN